MSSDEIRQIKEQNDEQQKDSEEFEEEENGSLKIIENHIEFEDLKNKTYKKKKKRQNILKANDSFPLFTNSDDYDKIQNAEENTWTVIKTEENQYKPRNSGFSFFIQFLIIVYDSIFSERQKKENSFQKFKFRELNLQSKQNSFQRMLSINSDEKLISQFAIYEDKKKENKLIPLSDKKLLIKYDYIFNNYQEELNIFFNESYSYFKNQGDLFGKNDSQLNLRNTLKASLGYQQNEIEQQQSAVIKQQKDFLFYFGVLIKQHLKCKTLLEVLLKLDIILTKQFLPNLSFTKFMFENQNGQWFTISQNQKEKIKFSQLGTGPWQWNQQYFQSKHIHSADSNIYFYDMNQASNEAFDFQLKSQIEKLKLASSLPPQTIKNSVQGSPFLQSNEQLNDTPVYLIFLMFPCKEQNKNEESNNQSPKLKGLERNSDEDFENVYLKSSQAQKNISKRKKKKNLCIKNIMHVWYLTDMTKFEVNKKVSYLNALKLKKRQSIMLLADAIADGTTGFDSNKQKNEDGGKHSMLQAINLCKDIWKLIRGRETQIKDKINQLYEKRQRFKVE